MDVRFFLKQRTSFIRFFFLESRKPFDQIKHQIENELPPYEPSPFNPDYSCEEPPFLDKWMDAELGIQMLGRSCISMLSDTLKVYFKELERQFGFVPTEEFQKKVFKQKGFVEAYKELLTEILDTDWADCPVDFGIIEQIVLTRNQTQHGDALHSFDIAYNQKAIKKHPNLHFVGEQDKGKTYKIEDERTSWFGPYIEISEKDLFQAIDEIEKLAQWIEAREGFAHKWRQNAS